MALSPDGRHFLYVGRQGEREEIYHRPLDQIDFLPIGGTEGVTSVFFSPDGEWVGLLADGKLKKVSLAGGAPLTICDDNVDIRGASWGPDGNIIFGSAGSGLYKVSAAGGTPQSLTTLDREKRESAHLWPEILANGEAVLFTIQTGGSSLNTRIGVLSSETGEWSTVLESGRYARYSPTGHLLYVRSQTLLAVPFDLKKLQVTGDPVPILEDVSVNLRGGVAHFAFSRNGVLVYLPATQVPGNNLVWVDRKGMQRLVTETTHVFETPRLSPDGQRLAITIRGLNDDVWIYELARGTLRRLTFDAEEDETPIWTPDSKRVTFSTFRAGRRSLFWKPADGSTPEELLLAGESNHRHLGSWSLDGTVLAFQELDPETGWDIWVLPLEGERKPQPFLRTTFNEDWPTFSPNGRWLVYISDESGRNEVYVQPFPGPGSQVADFDRGGHGGRLVTEGRRAILSQRGPRDGRCHQEPAKLHCCDTEAAV